MAKVYFVSRTWIERVEGDPIAERIYCKTELEAFDEFRELQHTIGSERELLEVVELDTDELEERVIRDWVGNEEVLFSQGDGEWDETP